MTSDQVDEAALWGAAAEGGGEAFGRVFDLHRDRVYAAAVRWLGSAPDAEDVAASAFLELWRRRRDVRLVNGSVLPWLLVTTANLARNNVRAHRRHRQFLERLPGPAASPAAEALAVDGADLLDPRLRDAMRRLPARDAALLSMLAFEDLSVADAAAALGINVQAAKTRLHRARGRVRALLPDLDLDLASEGALG